MSLQKNRTKKQEHFNDLLLPIIFTLCVLPFITYLAEYDYGYSKYDWHSDNSVLQDLYTYYRSIFFLVFVFFAVVILAFWMGLYRERIRKNWIFIPFFAYGVFSLVSAICSENQKAAWFGNFVDFEGFFVLIGYLVIGFYTYQMMRCERDFQSVIRAVLVMFVPMSVIGWFQVGKCDLLGFDWVQRLVMSDALYAEYGGMVEDVFSGNNVFLTLYNPNFAAIFLVMFAAVFAVFFLGAQNKKERVLFGALLVDTLILCWFTYTRAALVALFVVAVTLIVCMSAGRKNKLKERNESANRESGKNRDGKERLENVKALRFLVIGGIGIFVALFVVDAINGGKYLSRLIDEPKDAALESIITTAEGVEITYEGETYRFALSDVAYLESAERTPPEDLVGEVTLPEDLVEEVTLPEDLVEEVTPPEDLVGEVTLPEDLVEEAKLTEDGTKDEAQPELTVTDESGNEIVLAEIDTNEYQLPFSEGGYVSVVTFDEDTQMMFLIDDMTLQFTHRAAGYYYETEWGKYDTMMEIPHVDFHGYEYLGSGRLYIWSRVLPMLADYLIKGSGPDTFAEVYPQNDYVGKMVYAENPGRIMERAHNDFLMRWVQTGLLSVLALVVFYVWFLRRGFGYYRKCTLISVREKLGFGCFLGCVGYLICCVFSDSTLYTTPVFYVFVGIALAAMEQGGEE